MERNTSMFKKLIICFLIALFIVPPSLYGAPSHQPDLPFPDGPVSDGDLAPSTPPHKGNEGVRDPVRGQEQLELPFRSPEIDKLLGQQQEEVIKFLTGEGRAQETFDRQFDRGVETRSKFNHRIGVRAARAISHPLVGAAQTGVLIWILSGFHHAQYLIRQARLEKQDLTPSDFAEIAEQSAEHVMKNGELIMGFLGGEATGVAGDYPVRMLTAILSKKVSSQIFQQLVHSGIHSLIVFGGWELGGQLWSDAIRMLPNELHQKAEKNFWAVWGDSQMRNLVLGNMWKLLYTDPELRSALFYNTWRHRIATGDFISLVVCMTVAGVVGTAIFGPVGILGCLAFGLVGGFADMAISQEFKEYITIGIKFTRVDWNYYWKGRNTNHLNLALNKAAWARIEQSEWAKSTQPIKDTYGLGWLGDYRMWGITLQANDFGADGITEEIGSRRKLRENIINPYFEMLFMAYQKLENIYFERDLILKLKAEEDEYAKQHPGRSLREDNPHYQEIVKNQTWSEWFSNFFKESCIIRYLSGGSLDKMLEQNHRQAQYFEDLVTVVEPLVSKFYEDELEYFNKLEEGHQKDRLNGVITYDVARSLRVEKERIKVFSEGFMPMLFKRYHKAHTLPCSYWDPVLGKDYLNETLAELEKDPRHFLHKELKRKGLDIQKMTFTDDTGVRQITRGDLIAYLEMFLKPCEYHSAIKYFEIFHYFYFSEDFTLSSMFGNDPHKLIEEWGVNSAFLRRYYLRESEDPTEIFASHGLDISFYQPRGEVPLGYRELLKAKLLDLRFPADQVENALGFLHVDYAKERKQPSDALSDLRRQYEAKMEQAMAVEQENLHVMREDRDIPFEVFNHRGQRKFEVSGQSILGEMGGRYPLPVEPFGIRREPLVIVGLEDTTDLRFQIPGRDLVERWRNLFSDRREANLQLPSFLSSENGADRYSLFYDSQRRSVFPIKNGQALTFSGTWRKEPWQWRQNTLDISSFFDLSSPSSHMLGFARVRQPTPFELEREYFQERRQVFTRWSEEGSHQGIYFLATNSHIPYDRIAQAYHDFLERNKGVNIFSSYYQEIKDLKNMLEQKVASKKAFIESEVGSVERRLIVAGKSDFEVRVNVATTRKQLNQQLEQIKEMITHQMERIFQEWHALEVQVILETSSDEASRDNSYDIYWTLRKTVGL